MITVGFVYNLKKNEQKPADTYLEWDDLETIKAIESALSYNCQVISIDAGDDLLRKLSEVKDKIDILFNITEGGKGSWREAIVPIIAEELDIPYLGSDPATMVLCLNKQRTKEILSFHNIKTPQFRVFTEIPKITDGKQISLQFPLVVKPAGEGSSKGIKNSSLVMDFKQCQNEIARIIQEYKQAALVEEFISGREFTVAVLGNDPDIMALPLVEIDFTSLPEGAARLYSYEAKWVWDVPENPLDIFQCPAKVESALAKRIRKTAINAYKVLGCRDWCRVDVRLDEEGNPYILELNPIPGILPKPEQNSCFPKAARAGGWNYTMLINIVLKIACRRIGVKYEYDKKTADNIA